jgi:glycosyltransferase involved in cell wall biosynthesis
MRSELRRFFNARPELKARLRPAVWYYRRRVGELQQYLRGKQLQIEEGGCERAFLSTEKIGRRPGRNRTVVMLAIADLRFDPRIEREARALAAAGYKVTIIFPRFDGWKEAKVDWGKGVTFDPIATHAGTFAFEFPGYYSELFYHEAVRYRPFAFHAHDLHTAYIGIAAAKKTGAHLVCDFHEWISENVTYNVETRAYEPHSKEQKEVYRWLESAALEQASAIVTVCDSIADAMAEEFEARRRPVVIRNIPALNATPTRTYAPLKQQLGIPEDRFVLLWQGGTGPSRMIEPIVEALAFAPKCTFVIRGPSLETYGEGYRSIARASGFEDRLILQPPVPSRDVVAAARGADAGVWTLPNLCRNFSFALPNKIFEYIASGLPLLVADYPEARRMVETHTVGYTFDPYDPRSIAAAINRLIEDPAGRARFAANTQLALQAMQADREWQRLVEVYDALRSGKSLA